jgi:hypothetical protein
MEMVKNDRIMDGEEWLKCKTYYLVLLIILFDIILWTLLKFCQHCTVIAEPYANCKLQNVERKPLMSCNRFKTMHEENSKTRSFSFSLIKTEFHPVNTD